MNDEQKDFPTGSTLREKVWRIVFQHDKPRERAFDIVLLIMISISVIVVMLESVEPLAEKYVTAFHVIEWIFTILFTIEYVVRIWVVRRKARYIFSFYGIVDLLSILPTYLALLFAGSQYLMVIRILRLLRMFRILKMGRHMSEGNVLLDALRASRAKISVFIFAVMTLVCIEGTLMYLIEGGVEGSQFTSIPQAVYWGIVTITTVGYGDVAPITVLGKMLASTMMLTGFSIIAVPTGIVTAEIGRQMKIAMDERRCDACGLKGHDPAALYCKGCGSELPK